MTVAAVVLAAGLSTRMGRSKALMPWLNDLTVIETIVKQLEQTAVAHICVVTGHLSDEITAKLANTSAQTAYNPDFATHEMLSSLKVGLRTLASNIGAVLVVLGDQPRLEATIVQQIIDAFTTGQGEIIAPLYHGQRGHPVLISRRYWDELLALPADGAPRDVLNRHKDAVHLLNVESDSILGDIDTPEDYALERSRAETGR